MQEPATAKLGGKALLPFEDWCNALLQPEEGQSLTPCPATLRALLKEFGVYLFNSKHSLYVYRQLLAQLLRDRPSLRGHVGSFAGNWFQSGSVLNLWNTALRSQ